MTTRLSTGRLTVLIVHTVHPYTILIRDLKLGNVFLNDSMEVKIGDFGLATKVHIFIGILK